MTYVHNSLLISINIKLHRYVLHFVCPPKVMTAAEAFVKEEGHQSDDEDSFYFKGVKHLCETGVTHVPSKYILPVSDRPHLINEQDDVQELNLKLPIIDFAELHGSNRSRVLDSLRSACENHGFFQLVNHGISGDVISNMMDVGRRFFELPFEERQKLMSTDMRSPVRYGTSFNQTKDGVFCWRDFLKLVCHPLSDVLPHWPSSPLDFRNKGVAYANESKAVFLKLVEAILESLELTTMGKRTRETEEILKEFEDGSHLMVLNCYPPCPQPELTFGMPPHSDYGFVTLVLQDEVAGLQIMEQNIWHTVQPVPNSFVVNVGDHLEIFSNGRYKSVLHRVLANSRKSRISVASLHSLPFESTVRPWPKLIDEKNPRQYMDTHFSDFQNYLDLCDAKKKNFLESRKLTKLKIADNTSLES
ncbi:probable 2-oxoglutarate-dependent dioxygenase SLC1 isoform X1 [Daucus carota subsp. sativus]